MPQTAPDGPRPAVFLDRDGVIDELVWDAADGAHESPLRAADVALISGAAGAIDRLADAGYTLVVVSNQPAAAKGKAQPADLDAVHARVVTLLGASAGRIAAWRYCRHHPEALVAALRERCACRKPAPGLLLAAQRDLGLDPSASWMVGDADTDVEAGRAAGCRTVLVEHPASAHRRRGGEGATARADDLAGAAQIILRSRTGADRPT